MKWKKILKKNVVIVVPNLVCGAINVHTAARKKIEEKNNLKYHASRWMEIGIKYDKNKILIWKRKLIEKIRKIWRKKTIVRCIHLFISLSLHTYLYPLYLILRFHTFVLNWWKHHRYPEYRKKSRHLVRFLRNGEGREETQK